MRRLKAVAALLMCMGLSGVSAATTSDTTVLSAEARQVEAQAASQGAARVKSEMVSDFKPLAGSKENAEALVSGLRTGGDIELVSAKPDGTKVVTTVENTAKPMGWGNVFIALALTQESLAQRGITEPTAAELAAALNGGSVIVGGKTVELQGVLAMRASGMGWGRIAQSLDVKLGQVVSRMKSGNEKLAAAGRTDRAANDSAKTRGKSEHVRADKAERVSNLDRVEKAERREELDRPGRPERADRPDRPDRPDHPERPDRPERPERGGKGH